MEYILLIGGLLLLVLSGEFLVKGAVSIAYKFKMSPLVVGMTVVSLGTSAPELLVSVQAALDGHPDIALGNVIGSNIANLALVMGITALIFPLMVSRNTLRYDWPAMAVATLLFWGMVMDGVLDRWEGVVLLVSLITFIAWLIRKSIAEGQSDKEVSESTEEGSSLKAVLLVFAGCVGLVFGASWMLDGAVQIAQSFGVSERIIALTVVAFGTSVPELVTSCVAAFRRQTDISIGNLVGSNLFNIAAILGITSIIEPIAVTAKEIITVDMVWMVLVTLALFPLMYFGKKINMLKGLALVAFYLCYLYFII